MKGLFIYLLFLLYLGLDCSWAYDIKPNNQRIEKFVNAQGFYQNTVNAITSDGNGYLWIATPNGLVRYDGYSFEYHHHDAENPESIPNNFISNLLKDSQGVLWIGTRQGICLYFADKEQFFTLMGVRGNISFIKEDAQKRVWIGEDLTLHIFKTQSNQNDTVKQIAEIALENKIEGNSIVDIEFLSDSVLMVATDLNIYKIILTDNSYSVDVSILNYDFQTNGIRKILKIENSIWIGTNNGLYQTVPDRDQLITVHAYFESKDGNITQPYAILSLFVDQGMALWIGTERNGYLKYKNEKNDFISFVLDPKIENGLTSNRINCFYEDAFGVMWIGTAQGGINKLDKNQKPFQNYSNNPYDDQSLSGNLITDIYEDNMGRIWLSFFDKMICRTKGIMDLNSGKKILFERLAKQLGQINNQWVQCLFQDLKGYWWIGTQQNVYLFDEANEKLRKVWIKSGENEISSTINKVIRQIDAHHILIGGAQVSILKDPWESVLSDKPVQVESILADLGKNNIVNDFAKDGFGYFWLATHQGVFQLALNKGKLEIINHLTINSKPDSLQLSYNNIFSIHTNLNKDIWLGSFGGGLMKIQLNPVGKPEKIKVYNKRDGLPDEAIYGILEDAKGIFWLSTDMGICRFDPVTERFEVYDVNDGILNNNFRQSAYLKTKSGIMLMGGLNGLTIFDPEKIEKNSISPDVLITRLKINNQTVFSGKPYNGKIIINQSISDTKKLILSPNNRNLSLDIIVQHSAAPQKNRLSYILEGVNSDWVDVSEGKATATYTNLSPGTYRFKYKGSNGDGVGSKKTGELIIEVLAPWYLRWWSLTLWGLLVILIGYEVFDYLVRLEKLKQKLKFEQIDKERLHEMDQAKLRFFTNISHEFKTPLSLIIGPLEKIAEQNNYKENNKYFSIIQNNILRLQRLIEQLISYRKAETGNLELSYSKTSLGDFIYPILEAFEENVSKTRVNFFYKVNTPNKEVILDLDKTESILLNLFSNAVKYAGLNGNVSIEAGFIEEVNSEILYIEVNNNGKGISPENMDRIFDRFFSGIDSEGNLSGTGIGLALCKSLIDLMKGTITVESIPDEKTTFKVSLPFNTDPNIELKDEIRHRRPFAMDWLSDRSEVIHAEHSDLPTLLVIDDESDVRLFLKEVFENKYHVILAVDGEDGLLKLAEHQPQLVICDLMMPKLNGYQVCEKIKSNPETCHIPVILLTAIDDDAKKMEGLESGADDYISKPFSVKHLEIRVRKLIQNKQLVYNYFSKSSIIPDGDLCLSAKERHFLQNVTSSIEKNISDSNFGVEELAKEAGMSTSHFYRRLKQLTGQVPNVYLRNFRLQKAAELLKANKDLNATEVMYEIGIESPSYFSTSFKKVHGVSPSEFIRNLKD